LNSEVLNSVIVYPHIAIIYNNSPKLWNTCICTSLKLKGTKVLMEVFELFYSV